jgi:hypothetical protein
MTDPVAALLLRQLELVDHDLMGLARAMPTEVYAFRPAGDGFSSARTFGEQVMHAATLMFLTAAVVLEERAPHAPGPNNNGPVAIGGKARIVAYCEDAIRYARTAMASVTRENHLDLLPTVFGPKPRIEIAAGVVYHSYNHYGQLVVYARLCGIVPPSSQRSLPG